MTKAPPASNPSKLIDAHIKELGGWRGETLARIRALIKEADPAVVEEWKWDIPVWSHDGIICTGETYKSAVKTTFAKGAALAGSLQSFSTPASKARCAAPSIFPKAARSMRKPSRHSSAPPWR